MINQFLSSVIGALLLLLLSPWIIRRCFPLWTLPMTSFSVLFKSAINSSSELLHGEIMDSTSRKGPVVRIGVNEVVVTDLALVKSFYATFRKWPEWYESPQNQLFYGKSSLFGMTRAGDHQARRRLLSNVFSKSLRTSPHVQVATRQVLVEGFIRKALAPSSSDDILIRDLRALHGSFNMDFMTAFAFTHTHSTRFLNNQDQLPQFQSQLTDFRNGSPDGKVKLEQWCLSMCQAYYAENPTANSQRASNCSAGALYSAGLQKEEVASELLDHFVTATKNLAVFHTYAVYTLSLYMGIQERLRQELAFLSLDTLSIDNLDSLEFFNAVILELMRTHTEIKALTPRVVPQGGYHISPPTTGKSHFLPAGTVVSSTREALHQNESVFPEPLAFWPERWLEDGSALPSGVASLCQPSKMRNHLWYFGSGMHGCVAREYSLYEIKILLAATYMQFSTTLVDYPTEVQHEKRPVVFPPASAVPVQFHQIS